MKLHQQPLTEKTAERTAEATADAAHTPRPERHPSRNRHQLQFKCTGTRQAAHRIAETASRPARAGTST